MGGGNGTKQYLKDNLLVTNKHLEEFRGQSIAIDASGMIHRLMIHSGNKKWWLQFINLIHKFSKYGITPVIVFDGSPCNEKKMTIEERKKRQEDIKLKCNNLFNNINFEGEEDEEEDEGVDLKLNSDTCLNSEIEKNKYSSLLKLNSLLKQINSIKVNDIKICKEICILLGILYIHIKSQEADDIFLHLIKNKYVDGIYSEDNDLFRRQCDKVYFGLDFNLDTIYEFNYDECLQKMNITTSQFNNAYDASGTDFNDNLEYCKFKDNIKLMILYGTIEEVIANLDIINLGKTSRIIKVPKNFDYIKTREIFNRELSKLVIKNINNNINQYHSIIDTEKTKYKEYSQTLFNEIDILCENNKKESCKYIKKIREFYKNIHAINV
jgi:5'-3' exonuclease